EFRQGEKEIPIAAFRLTQRGLLLHVDGFVFDFAFAFRRADFDAEAAAGAILRSHLQCEAHSVELAPTRFGGFESLRGMLEQGGIINLGANDGVRANEDALAALNAKLLVPDGNFLGDVALLPHGGASGEGAINGHGADGERIAVAGYDGAENIADEERRLRRNGGEHIEESGDPVGDFDFAEM